MSAEPVHELVDHLFRHESGRMVASLTRIFGPANLGIVEEVVQEALLRALDTWAYHGVPRNPPAWLHTVARRRALDVLRRDRRFSEIAAKMAPLLEAEDATAADAVETRAGGGPADDRLRLIFTCCHPDVPADARVAITLKTVCGFGVAEIARAFLKRESAIAQRLVRAKRFIRERRIPYEVPAGPELAVRLDTVLEVLTLMFNEGYCAYEGEEAISADLCHEAIRLAGLLAGDRVTDSPKVHALLAFLLFQAARLPARLDGAGDIVLLGEQDRAAWDRAMIDRGADHLRRAMAATRLGPYHLQAGIAACHAAAVGESDTDWTYILGLYDLLMRIRPSPVVELNRGVAVAMAHGPRAGLEALDRIKDEPSLADYHFLPATRGELYLRCGRRDAAAACFHDALALARNAAQRRLLIRKLAACSG